MNNKFKKQWDWHAIFNLQHKFMIVLQDEKCSQLSNQKDIQLHLLIIQLKEHLHDILENQLEKQFDKEFF